MTEWVRHRFRTSSDDYRPITFPPPGPYWCTAGIEPPFTLVAYLPKGVPLFRYWPEAEDITQEEKSEIVFTSRFPRPGWYDEAPGSKEGA